MAELKKHLSLDQQVTKLIGRGLIINDRDQAKRFLFNTNYYRLSGYLHDFKIVSQDRYVDGLSLHRIKRIYDFDRKFARIIMYALEDVEETLKSRFSYTITSRYPDDPLIYLKPTIYRKYDPYFRFLCLFYGEVDKNKSLPFVKHHKECYDGFFPMWVAVELLTMGNLSALFNNLESTYQKALAKAYSTGPVQLQNWIENMTFIRNHLAHYMRIYNFNFGRTPKKCINHAKYIGSTNMIFDHLFVAAQMYSDPQEWNQYVISEIKDLLSDYSDTIELASIGFPHNWEDILVVSTKPKQK